LDPLISFVGLDGIATPSTACADNNGDRRPSYSPKTKRGGLRPTWRSCRSSAGRTRDEARRIAANIAKVLELLARHRRH